VSGARVSFSIKTLHAPEVYLSPFVQDADNCVPCSDSYTEEVNLSFMSVAKHSSLQFLKLSFRSGFASAKSRPGKGNGQYVVVYIPANL
jgi:hypothetical protein